MKKVKIYIDFGAGEDVDFGEQLQKRLQSIKGNYEVSIFNDLFDNNLPPSTEEEWEQDVIEAINSSDVIIPILSADYLTFVTEKIQEKFEEAIKSKEKFLFPILYGPSDWSNIKWVVKSNLIPEDGTPISEISKNEQDRLINGFVKTIGNVITSINKPNAGIVYSELNEQENIIFISHDHDDSDFAELLKLRLEKEGIDSWVDTERLKIGQDWREEIDKGIENSLALIAIMTPEARKSEYVTYEWAFAWGKGVRVFPIMLKQTQLHPRLESLQYLDFTNKANRPWDELISEIKKLK